MEYEIIPLPKVEWSNRLMVTELWVADELHRQGIGTRLMNVAKEQARLQGRRAIILETQSCNACHCFLFKSRLRTDRI